MSRAGLQAAIVGRAELVQIKQLKQQWGWGGVGCGNRELGRVQRLSKASEKVQLRKGRGTRTMMWKGSSPVVYCPRQATMANGQDVFLFIKLWIPMLPQ